MPMPVRVGNAIRRIREQMLIDAIDGDCRIHRYWALTGQFLGTRIAGLNFGIDRNVPLTIRANSGQKVTIAELWPYGHGGNEFQ
ncbi:hypothetical protein [Nocardia sp. NBC_01327]|uniref:hypothetical protein n=1 Tax=Nocardia sp. NBC_01327 TaxID=2903593 RepID=UPI002E15C312|nr:hypothetical protein OG326_40005 [Nocardia sp. NBC_01327]